MITIKKWAVALPLCCAAPLHALTLQNVAAINFGTIDYSPPVSGAIQLGTNGTVIYNGSYSGTGIGTAGQLEIQDTNGTVVQISCESGKIANAGIVVDMTNTPVVGSAYTANWGTTPVCAGAGSTVATHTVGAGAALNTIYLGGSITPGSIASGAFTTAKSGGQPVRVQVIVQ